MKHLLLIHPSTNSNHIGYGEAAAWRMPPLGLGYVAALTPPGWEIKIVDEYIEELVIDNWPDLVGIGTFTVSAVRAYSISEQFRRKGITTVLGGIHASLLPREATKYADTVVIGEAESVWPELVTDFERGLLKKTYTAERLSMKGLPIPRRDLFSARYGMDVIQTTRGCPHNCNYCSVTVFNGNVCRRRPTNEVLDELEQISKKVVYFIDDNIIGTGNKNEQDAIDLFKGMVERKTNKIWATQASIDFADNDTTLKWAYRSGCRSIYIGFETLNEKNLALMKKELNKKKGISGYKKAVKKIHRNGISVVGAFMLGNKHDDQYTFDEIERFLFEARIDVLSLAILTPLPGTKIFEEMKAEKRLLYTEYPRDWEYYDTDQIVFHPYNMELEQLIEGYGRLIRSRFSKKRIFIQAIKTLMETRSASSTLISYMSNKGIWEYMIRGGSLDILEKAAKKLRRIKNDN